MKRIAIFCDGTWNRSDRVVLEAEGRPVTSILRLSEAVAQGAVADGTEQISFYIDGVGTPETAGRLRHAVDKYGGGAFGWGLDDKILKAYRFLVRHYRPGDDIFLFGFSRGAYAARSLAGLMRNCGLPDRDDRDLLGHLMGVYRSRDPEDAPWTERARRLREWVNPRLATDPAELAERTGDCSLLRIAYMGIFDTVGALGVPELWPGLARVNARYRFHDQQLSSMVRAARHAISIDEPRITYKSVPWDAARIDALNAAAEAAGAMPFRQMWFPGVHGTVGGSLAPGHEGLGMAAMGWIAEGARAAGLEFDAARLDPMLALADPAGPFGSPDLEYGAVDRLTLRRFDYQRPPVPGAAQVSDVARARWHLEEGGAGFPYRPVQLRGVAAAEGWPG
ncbi:DUF2235 domain-containing protein [Mangrovicoccus algicola]|uniref:DUF2235 domain-containing protein n=1 Tax=Mangrovicoccus algicola TaxID=2771008 RepID=A0A8J6YU36_9RHOB|nr:DUF2235 domain-containing protein [Mangrovicoccus algicola]MBE3637720.1 DUF2235 domain-containing protein [Mangrovicoccus algicola]